MNQVKKILFAVLSKALNFILARKNVGAYVCFAALYGILCGMIGFAVLVLTVLQGIVLLILTKPNAAIKSLSHRMTVYIYKMMRYIILCETQKPYPFGPIPQEIEPADDVDLRADLPEKNFFDREEGPKPAADAGKGPTPESTDAPQDERPQSEKKEEKADPIPMGYKEDKKED